ncbi:MAG: BrnT family toxin, partial [Candidatus Scalindua sp.]
FELAQFAFNVQKRVIAEDLKHSHREKRYYCFGKVEDAILTVRFTYRKNVIRIIGAGHWRKGKTKLDTLKSHLAN